MRRLLLSLIIVLAIPTAVNTETYWLFIKGKAGGTSTNVNWSIPKSSRQEYKNAKAEVIKKDNWDGPTRTALAEIDNYVDFELRELEEWLRLQVQHAGHL